MFILYGPKGLSVLIFLTPLATILKEEGALVSDGNPLTDIFSTVKPAGFNVTDESITEAAISSLSLSLSVSSTSACCVWSSNMRGDAISDFCYNTWRLLCGYGLDILLH